MPLTSIVAGCLLLATGTLARGQSLEEGLDPLPYRLPADFDSSLQAGYVEPSATNDRLAALEAEVNRLSSADAKRKADAEKKPTFQIGGQLQTDYLYFGQDAESQAALGDINDGVYFRRARLTARGEAFETVEYAIGFDFALPGRPSFLDVFVGMHDLPLLGNARVGHFFEPFSLNRITFNRYHTFMEHSLADAFAPARNTGINAYDTYGNDENGTWSIGWFASNSDNYGDQFMDAGGQALTGRLTWLPFYDEASEGRSYIHVGGGYSYRTPPNGNLFFAPFPEARPGTPTPASVQPFVNTGLISAEHNQLFGAELAWIAGPLSFQAEYMYVPVEQNGGPELAFQGAYAFVSYFLTGEHRPYNKKLGIHDRVIPFEDFFRVRTCDGPIIHGRGAWELAARWSYIDLTDENIVGGVEHNGTIGLNWYLNPYTRVKWEYIVAQVDRPPVGDSTTHIAGMRFDIDF
ncbi:MAG: porin [Pirellulaceae bacterium]|nr:porin [Pirellulaceae bacterium]